LDATVSPGVLDIGVLELPIERSVSRTGRHAARRVAVIIRSNGAIEVVGEPSRRGSGCTYSKGVCGVAEVRLDPGDVAVEVRLVRSHSGRVSGEFVVYDHTGSPVLVAVYRRLKVRRSRGDPSYAWAVEAAVKALKMERYVRRFNWRTGAG
jgi:hypothetical protein